MRAWITPEGYTSDSQEVCSSTIEWFVCKVCRAQIPDDSDITWEGIAEKTAVHTPFTTTHTAWHDSLRK